MSDMLAQSVNLLVRSPRLYTLEPTSLRLVQNARYVGIYFTMVTAAGIRLHLHATVGHWQEPVTSALSARSQNQILTDFQKAVDRAWTSSLPIFAESPETHLGHRVLVTLHVQGGLSAAMWNMQGLVKSELNASEGKKRTNFHFSVDAVV